MDTHGDHDDTDEHEAEEKAQVDEYDIDISSLQLHPLHPLFLQPNDHPDYVLEGSQGTPFAGGYYYGKIKFPPEYPFKSPGISSSRKLESNVVCVKAMAAPDVAANDQNQSLVHSDVMLFNKWSYDDIHQFGYIVLTTSVGIMDHEEGRRKNVGSSNGYVPLDSHVPLALCQRGKRLILQM